MNWPTPSEFMQMASQDKSQFMDELSAMYTGYGDELAKAKQKYFRVYTGARSDIPEEVRILRANMEELDTRWRTLGNTLSVLQSTLKAERTGAFES